MLYFLSCRKQQKETEKEVYINDSYVEETDTKKDDTPTQEMESNGRLDTETTDAGQHTNSTSF